MRAVGVLAQPVILSTGMSDLGEIEDAINILEQSGTPRNDYYFALYYRIPCTSKRSQSSCYANNVSCIGVCVGSDHTNGITIPVAAASMGVVIEAFKYR